MALLKKLCKDFNVVMQVDFYASGNGKGLINAVGGVLRRAYATECVKELKTKARVVKEIVSWINTSFHQFSSADKGF